MNETENETKKNHHSIHPSNFSLAAERAPVGEVAGPVAARELVEPRDVGHCRAPEAQSSCRRENKPVARAAAGDKGGCLVAAARRDGVAVAIAGEVWGEGVAVGPVVGRGEVIDCPLHVVDERGAFALADLHGEADAVGSSTLDKFRDFRERERGRRR